MKTWIHPHKLYIATKLYILDFKKAANTVGESKEAT